MAKRNANKRKVFKSMYENTYEEIVKAQNGDEEAMASLVKNNLVLV